MQIKEVQEKLKISSYTLRYYEKMGLIQPYRDENGYRNYSEEDVHKIERIMFLRDINVPIEDIKDILNNKVTFQDVLENHIEKVNTEIESLQYIKNMCEDLKEKNIPLLDQVIEDNQIGDKKVKKRDLKKVFDYFKKDQTVIIGTKFDLNMYFRTFICALITAPILAIAAIKYLHRFIILNIKKNKMKKKKIVALLTACMLMTGMFTGCGSSQQAAGSSGAEAGQPQTGDNSLFNEPGQLPIVNEPVTLTVFAPANPDGSCEDNEMVKELEETTGIHLEWQTCAASDNVQEKLSTMFASGDLPDIILTGVGSSNRYDKATEHALGEQ